MNLRSLIQDPPPLLVFELAEGGLSAVRRNPKTGLIEARAERELEGGVIEASATKPNVRQPDKLVESIRSALEQLGPVRRMEAAVLLPDAASWLTTIDFDTLPGDANEQIKLIRFRVAKSVPFDALTARIAYQVEKFGAGRRVLVALTPAEIVEQYEEVFEQAGIWPGHVTGSMAAALNLVSDDGMSLLAKISGWTMTLAAVQGGAVRIVRSIALSREDDVAVETILGEILSDLFPTMVFVEDKLGVAVDRLALAGFGTLLNPALERLGRELDCVVEPLRSAEGVCGPRDAGIWGYLSLL